MRSENLMGPFQLASRFPSKSMPWMSILSHGRCTLFSICDMSFFPQGGLTQPMQAAIRGDLDQLLLSDLTLLGDSTEEIRKQETVFRSYQVSIKSACN